MNNFTGQRFGNYSLLRLLGRGSVSEVYLAEHIEQKAQAAVKILQMKLASGDQESFLAQTRLLGQFKHPHIVRIWEAGVQNKTPFLAMTYAPHGSLHTSHPPGTCLAQEQILSYVQQITAALQYLHDQQLTYRDLRPQNLLLLAPNNIILADFALSLISQTSRSLNMQEMMGDVTYMAPEQLQGKPGPSSDQYALGIIVYEWLSGKAPFTGTFTEVASQHAFTPPAPLHATVPKIMPAVEEVVQIALSKDPQWRFASVRAFSHAFEQACQRNQPPLEARTFRVPEKSIVSDKQELASAKQPVAQLTSNSTQASTVQTLPPPPSSQKSAHPLKSSRTSTLRKLLLGTLALLVIISAGGLALWQHSTQTEAQSASEAQKAALTATALQGHLQATTIARADANAEATADAAANIEATATVTAMQNLYTQSTQGTPVMNDPLTANDRFQWDEGPTARHESCTFIKGAYHIIEPQSNSYDCYANATNFSNFAFQVQVTILKGDLGGLDFLANTDHTQNCFFGLYGTGDYVSGCISNGIIPFTIYSWKAAVGNKSPHTNLLTVIVRNQQASLYVNKQYIGSFKESPLTSGAIGLFAHDFTSSTEVTFNNAQVWSL